MGVSLPSFTFSSLKRILLFLSQECCPFEDPASHLIGAARTAISVVQLAGLGAKWGWGFPRNEDVSIRTPRHYAVRPPIKTKTTNELNKQRKI